MLQLRRQHPLQRLPLSRLQHLLQLLARHLPLAQLRHPHPVRTTATARMCGTASAVQSAHMTPDTALDSTAMAMAWAAKEILGNSAPHSAFDFPLPPAHELSVQGFSYARGNESSGIPH